MRASAGYLLLALGLSGCGSKAPSSPDARGPGQRAPAAAAAAAEHITVSSDIAAIRIVTASQLPPPERPMPLSGFCKDHAIEPKTPAGKDAARRGWHVGGELPLGPYEAVAIFNEAGDGTSGSCLVVDGNVLVYRGEQLVAIAYGPPTAEEHAVGDIGAITATTMPNTIRIWPGSVGAPVADLNLTATGLAVTATASEEAFCDGHVRVPGIYGMTLKEARPRLKAFGWAPSPPKDDANADPSIDLAAHLRKEGWIEVHDCAGTGFGFCGVEYRHKNGALLEVTTVEGPSVIDYSARCP